LLTEGKEEAEQMHMRKKEKLSISYQITNVK